MSDVTTFCVEAELDLTAEERSGMVQTFRDLSQLSCATESDARLAAALGAFADALEGAAEKLDGVTVDLILKDPHDGQELTPDGDVFKFLRNELEKVTAFGRGRLVRARVALTVEPWPEPARRSVAVLIPRAGHFAAIRSVKHDGRIELPGGKIEAGELPADAARRKVREELGVPLVGTIYSLGQFEHEFEGQRWICDAFVGSIIEEPPGVGDAGETTLATRDELIAGPYGAVVAEILAAYDARIGRLMSMWSDSHVEAADDRD